MNVHIRPVVTQDERRALIELEQRVWPGVPPMREDILLIAQRNGGQVLGAFDVPTTGAERMVGLLFGYVGRASDGRYRHWSHMVGVDPAYRDRKIGYDLKMVQRERVLDQGLDTIAWSYDPLLGRNAHLNLHKLGAVCCTYAPDFYGAMTDAVNAGLPSDRFEVEWHIAGRHVAARLNGSGSGPLLSDLLAGGAQLVKAQGSDDVLAPSAAALTFEAVNVCVQIPRDFHALKRRDIALACAWREHTRELFQSAFARGYWAVDFLSEDSGTFYLLQKDWQPF
jgi:chorismate synthase